MEITLEKIELVKDRTGSTYAEAKAALELDPLVTDWEAKAEAYKAELDKLESERIKRIGEIEEAMATMSCLN